MDPDNEGHVFNLIVKSAAEGAHHFLLTPKVGGVDFSEFEYKCTQVYMCPCLWLVAHTCGGQWYAACSLSLLMLCVHVWGEICVHTVQ